MQCTHLKKFQANNTSTNNPILKNVDITPDSQLKGESVGDALPIAATGSDDMIPTLEPGSKKHKRNLLEGDIDINAPQKTHGVHINYKNLHDSYSEEEKEDNFLTVEEVYAIIAGDNLTSHKDAKNSPDCPEWEIARQVELNLLKERGTWEFVEKLPYAIPIANKWVFITKCDKEGKVIRYRVSLIAKGCAQCPGYNYMESILPVIRMDTLCTILALVLMLDLKLQQMDVKGTYLNGTSHETIYM